MGRIYEEIEIEGKKYKVNIKDFPITIGNMIIGSVPGKRGRIII